MQAILKKLISSLKQESCLIILFMDSADCHPEDLVGKYSNIDQDSISTCKYDSSSSAS